MPVMPPIPELEYRSADEVAAHELSLLPTFETLASLRSLSRTAHAHGISRGAVFKRVRALEAIVGQRLYRTRARSVELTAAGNDIAAYAERVLSLQRSRVRGAPRGSHRVVLACTTDLLAHLLAPSVEAFVAMKVAEIRVLTVTEAEAVAHVRAERADLAIVRRGVEGIAGRRLAAVRPVVVGRIGDPIVARERTSLAALEKTRLLCAPDLAPLHPRAEVVGSADAALELAAAGVGVALVEGFHRIRDTLRSATVDDLPATVLCLIHTTTARVEYAPDILHRILIEDVRRRLRRTARKQNAKTECLGGS